MTRQTHDPRPVQPGTAGHGTPADRPRPTSGESRQAEDRSFGQLVRELGAESSTLIREELRLAKAELREKAKVYEKNAATMAAGGVLLAGALFMLLVALNRGLTVLLEGPVGAETALWLSPVILAVLAGIIGWSMVKAAQSAMRREGVVPEETVETLREEKDWIQREAREVRHG